MTETIRPYLELIYFVTGGPLLAIFAFLALKQITVAKQTARTASLREAYRLSAEQTHVYATEIVPRINALDQAIEEKRITFFENAKVTVEADSIRIERKPAPNEMQELVEVVPAFMEAVNRLETFSLYFTSKVAAEGIAYSSVGATYVRSVRKLLPLIVLSANNQNHKNIMKLFVLWHSRLEKERLEREKSSIESRLRTMKTEEVVPIGTSRGVDA